MSGVTRLILLAGLTTLLSATPSLTLGDPESCPCDEAWHAALNETSCTSEIYLFNGMLRRDDVASQGTIIWWSLPYPEPSSALICVKARTFRAACDLILGVPEETRCVETEVLARSYYSSNKFFGICKESMRKVLFELDTRPNCE